MYKKTFSAQKKWWFLKSAYVRWRWKIAKFYGYQLRNDYSTRAFTDYLRFPGSIEGHRNSSSTWNKTTTIICYNDLRISLLYSDVEKERFVKLFYSLVFLFKALQGRNTTWMTAFSLILQFLRSLIRYNLLTYKQGLWKTTANRPGPVKILLGIVDFETPRPDLAWVFQNLQAQ